MVTNVTCSGCGKKYTVDLEAWLVSCDCKCQKNILDLFVLIANNRTCEFFQSACRHWVLIYVNNRPAMQIQITRGQVGEIHLSYRDPRLDKVLGLVKRWGGRVV